MCFDDMLRNVPYLTEENHSFVIPNRIYGVPVQKKELFKKIKECGAVIKEKWKNDVTGFWLVTELASLNGLQVIVNSKLPKEQEVALCGLVGDYLEHEILYNISQTGNNYVAVLGVPLLSVAEQVKCDNIAEWVKNNKVYTIFDLEREEEA